MYLIYKGNFLYNKKDISHHNSGNNHTPNNHKNGNINKHNSKNKNLGFQLLKDAEKKQKDLNLLTIILNTRNFIGGEWLIEEKNLNNKKKNVYDSNMSNDFADVEEDDFF